MEPQQLNDRVSSGDPADQVGHDDQLELVPNHIQNESLSDRIQNQGQPHNVFRGYQEGVGDQDLAAPGNFNQGHNSINVQNIDNENL